MIQELEEKHQQNMEDVKTVVTELGLKYKLASSFTSFVGVDEKQNLSSVGVMRTRQIANHMPLYGFPCGPAAPAAPSNAEVALARMVQSRMVKMSAFVEPH